MQLLHLALGYNGPNWPVQLAGTALLVLPLLTRPSRWADADFRREFLASLLVYAVIFNHKAEQPSFVLAVVGTAIWYALSPRSTARVILTAVTYIATIPMLVTVAAPGLIADGMTAPLLTVSACCTTAWLIMQWMLLDPLGGRVLATDPAFTRVETAAD
jgi:hypothetical protein